MPPPEYLKTLYTEQSKEYKNFRININKYNSSMSMATAQMNRVNEQQPSAFKIHGEVYRFIGPMYPHQSQYPKSYHMN